MFYHTKCDKFVVPHHKASDLFLPSEGINRVQCRRQIFIVSCVLFTIGIFWYVSSMFPLSCVSGFFLILQPSYFIYGFIIYSFFWKIYYKLSCTVNYKLFYPIASRNTFPSLFFHLLLTGFHYFTVCFLHVFLPFNSV